MQNIACVCDGPMRNILVHFGEPTERPRIAPARGPLRWEVTDPEYDPAADPLIR